MVCLINSGAADGEMNASINAASTNSTTLAPTSNLLGET